ncbi:MAG: N-6 DNA methylase [Acidobacteriota bacterium]
MSDHAQWLIDLGGATKGSPVDGLVLVREHQRAGRPPEEVMMMEKAKAYDAHAVFFEAPREGRPPVAQAFVFISDDPSGNPQFAQKYRQLWSWGGVPLIYLKTPGQVRLFSCARQADFYYDATGELKCNPVDTLIIGTAVSTALWWNDEQLRNGALWNNTEACKKLLSAKNSAHKTLIDEVKSLYKNLTDQEILPPHLCRKLLILSLLIAYLEKRKVFEDDYFGRFLPAAIEFFHILPNGEALVALLDALETRFNGNVFSLAETDRELIRHSAGLKRFAELVEGRKEKSGQLTLWQRYSFEDLPVELISHIYQLFVSDTDSSVYTPPFLVRLMLDEALSWERLDRLQQRNEIILDPCCGSGVFLVEAYKRLVLHWRSRNEWKKPNKTILKGLLKKVHGIDLELGAVELAAFSLCLALCDALEPAEIRASIKLFDPLVGKTLHHSCFFEAKETCLVKGPIGVVVGNPPFTSSLNTEGAKRSYKHYQAPHDSLPDKQLAYLFLHEAMGMVAEGGVLCLLQQYNFLYNQKSLGFRRRFIANWDVREVLDFISVRGLFKDRADTKVVVVVAEAAKPLVDRKILHATFRRSGRADAEQGFDIDYYDLHWLPRQLVLSNDDVWRTNLLGGGRVLGFVDRLKKFRTLGQYVTDQNWDYGEGFIFGNPNGGRPASHVVGKAFLPAKALSQHGIKTKAVTTVPNRPIQRPRRPEIYSPPLLLVHKQMALNHGLWKADYITYTHEVLGISAARGGRRELEKLSLWLSQANRPLQAFVAGASSCLSAAKATAILSGDILSLPYPEAETLDLGPNEEILVDDIVDYYRDLIRLGEDSAAMKESGHAALPDFNDVFTRQINAVYKKKPLQALDAQSWSGVICQPFVFGKGSVDWNGADELQGKLDKLLQEQKGEMLRITRIARIYDGNFIFLLKPDRLRYWLRSVALRDADETLADMRGQGF